MDARTLATVALVAALALAACVGGATPGTDDQPSSNSTTADGAPVDDSTLDASDGGGMPAAPASLPATDDCLSQSVPSATVTAGSNDSLTGRSYPASPAATTSREAIGDFVAAFEEAHFYNGILADGIDEEDTLDRVTAQVTTVNVTRIQGGYLVVVEGLGATNFESGIHGDYEISAVYRLTPDAIERSDRLQPGERRFAPVVAC